MRRHGDNQQGRLQNIQFLKNPQRLYVWEFLSTKEQIKKQEESTNIQTIMSTQLESLWIVGFVDGEGCFNLDVHCHKTAFGGIQVQLEFVVVQHERDIQVLHGLKDYFGVGSVTVNRKDETSTRYQYRVKSQEKLATIIQFFQDHPLKTKKHIEFKRFRKIYLRLEEGEHLQSKAKLLEIIDLGANLRYPSGTRIRENSKVRQKIAELRQEVQNDLLNE